MEERQGAYQFQRELSFRLQVKQLQQPPVDSMAEDSFVPGGELGDQGGEQGGTSPAALQSTVVEILQDGETVKQ